MHTTITRKIRSTESKCTLKNSKLLNFFLYYSITGIKRFIFPENSTFSSKQSLTQTDSISLLEFKCSAQWTGLRSVKFIYSLRPTSPLIHNLFIYLFYFQVLFNWSSILDPDFPVNLEVYSFFLLTTEVISCSKCVKKHISLGE